MPPVFWASPFVLAKDLSGGRGPEGAWYTAPAFLACAAPLSTPFLFQLEPLPLPACYAPRHLLHFSIEAREADCRFIRSVAVRAAAVDHEGDVGRECGEVALDDSAVGQVDGSRDVAGAISFRAADIQNDVIGLAGLQVLVDIPAIGFEFE